jgi:hypothetical protein
MATTRIIYARVFDAAPDREAEGRLVRVMIYEDEGQEARPQSITFAEHVHPQAFAFFSQFDDHFMRLERPPG